MRRWIVIHLPSGKWRPLHAPSAQMAIALSGWPERDCIAEEAL